MFIVKKNKSYYDQNAGKGKETETDHFLRKRRKEIEFPEKEDVVIEEKTKDIEESIEENIKTINSIVATIKTTNMSMNITPRFKE